MVPYVQKIRFLIKFKHLDGLNLIILGKTTLFVFYWSIHSGV